ncbi:LysR family transcriptional regulator [Acuticoccus sp. M5D2P5]|uniref:LysR family transcriptional regulator n=1 Tax=Acuticoccus kalidii TaxID=2910977 RepID=UPI001F24B976|nr:LysR family transcriptional regulator [Acuticoccus kalidii]
MELRHIRYFLAVADEGNFTRAAARLGIGQPPLSQQIRDLEREVGAQLFHRVPHGAELTDAGLAFRERVAPLPELAADAMEAARRAARGEIGELNLGFTSTAALNPIVPRLIRTFRRERPDVALRLVEANSVALRDALLEGRLDAAILRPNDGDPASIIAYTLAVEPLVAAIPKSLDAAPEADTIDLAALSEEPLILTPRATGASLHDLAVAACRAAGFEPVLGQPAPQIASILSLVSAELGFSLVPASTRQLAIENIAYKTLAKGATADIAAAVLRGSLPPTAHAFIMQARALRGRMEEAPDR